MEAKLKELFPNAKPDEEEGIYSIINDDIKVIFADMKAEAKSTLFSIVLAVSDIPETIAFYEKFGVQMVAEDENNAVFIFKALESC